MDANDVTAAQVQQLRDAIDEQDTAEPYTDAALKSKIAAANGDVNVVAYYIWVSKAAALSSLVDISEGGSSRKNSQAYTNAKDMLTHFSAFLPSTDPEATGRRTRTRAIVRP